MSFRTLCFSANDYVRRIRHRLIDIGGHDYSLHYLLWSRAARWKSMTCRRIHLRQGYGGQVGVSLDAARCRSMPLDISLDLLARTWQWMRLREISDHKDRACAL